MASMMRGAINSLSPKNPDAKEIGDKYKLRVTAGAAYDTSSHKPVYVNTDEATYVENEFMRCKIKVRIRAYTGLPRGSKRMSPYFDDPIHEKDMYSIGFSFVPKKDLPSAPTVWGNDFDHPVRDRLPPGFNSAFKIVKDFIDPGLSCDAYAEQPWLYGPSLSCWFALRVGDSVKDGGDFPAPDEKHVMKDGADGSGREMRHALGIPDTGDKRRKFFLQAKNRANFTFHAGRCYQADFYNPYLDFGKLALKLPGFSLGVAKYIDDKSHVLRYVFKNRDTGDVYFNVNFTLLFGEQLKLAMAGDEQQANADAQKLQPSGTSTPATNGTKTSSSTRSQTDDSAEPAMASHSSLPPSAETPPQTPQEAVADFRKQCPAPAPPPPAQQAPQLGPERPPAHSKIGAREDVSEITEMLRGTATSDKTHIAKAGIL